MPTTVNIPPEVQKKIKRLKRKYPAVTGEVRKLVTQLEDDDRPGDKIAGVGYDVYKVRLPNPSAQWGKSGGFRVIYYVQLADHVILITIYSKTEQTDINPDKVRQVLESIIPTDNNNDQGDDTWATDIYNPMMQERIRMAGAMNPSLCAKVAVSQLWRICARKHRRTGCHDGFWTQYR